MGALTWFAAVFVVSFLTFMLFCAVLTLRSAHESGKLREAPVIVIAFALATLALGAVFDVLLNILLSPIFLEPPRELLTTNRCRRLRKSGTRWQRNCANWMCRVLSSLDYNHCKESS